MKKVALVTLVVLCTNLFANAQTVTAKFGKGIKFKADDNSFSLNFRFRQQQLFEGTFTEKDNGEFNASTNFMVRRSRLKFSGHAFSQKFTYKAELGLSSKDISTSNEDGNTGGSSRFILDAVLKYQFSDNWAILVGQTKLPGNRERVISSANLQFVDRSNLNSKFNIDRDAGLQLRGKYSFSKMVLKPSVAITKGEGRGISSANMGGYDYTAHLDILPMGDFANSKGDYISSDLERNETPKLSIGLTYDYNDRAVRQGGQLGTFVYNEAGTEYAENSLESFVADLMYKHKGVSIMSAYVSKTGNDYSLNDNYNVGTAFNSQLAYLFKNNLEIAGRYTMVRKAEESNLKSNNEYTLGVSKYIVGHSLKIQSDISQIETLNSDLKQYRFRMQLEMQL